MSSEVSDALEFDVLIDAPVALVWSAFAEGQHREAWWSYLDLDARPGGQLLERWCDADGQERQTRGQVLEADAAAHRLRCSWRDDDWPSATQVELTMGKEGGTTRVRLRHAGWDGLPDGARLRSEHREGWSRHLANLKDYAEGLAA